MHYARQDKEKRGQFLNDSTEPSSTRFVNPIEEVFARILDFYGIAWLYEPRTFPLAWDAKGNVTVAFAPDFYLPDQNLYVELTTLRPQLSTRKNWKMKRMSELYPEISIKLFKRRELRNMMLKLGMFEEAGKIFGTDALEAGEDETKTAG